VPNDSAALTHHRVVIVGTGFAGIAAAVTLKRQGIDDIVLLERAGDVGGTWRDNTYPGCQCDVASHLYSFSFAPNPEWSRTYPLQQELKDYLRRTAADFDVTRHVLLDTPLLDARWDDDSARWAIRTPAGVHTADILLMANGPLSEPKLPDVEGLGRFQGTTFHSAAWNHDHDLSGERVAVVGTGASAIQFLPHVQQTASQVVLLQRTPPWVMPHPDRRIRSRERALFRRLPWLQRLVRLYCYWYRELEVIGFVRAPKMMRALGRVGREHLERQVHDPALRAKLTPSYTPGCKRLLLSNDYYPALGQPNVAVVDAGAVEVREHSIVDGHGREHEVDTIIFGTGFHVSDNPVWKHVIGRDGRSVADSWGAGGMRAYKGTALPGFPNLFVVAGPNTGIGHTSLVVMIEAQLRYIADAVRLMTGRRARSVEVRTEALDRWNHDLQRRMRRTVWSTGGCASWYQDAAGRNPTLWPDFTWKFCLATRHFDPEAYEITATTAPDRGPASEPIDDDPAQTVTDAEQAVPR
jgi:cation diffusion facilitator CzcD-associated flavoprotein CzcO